MNLNLSDYIYIGAVCFGSILCYIGLMGIFNSFKQEETKSESESELQSESVEIIEIIRIVANGKSRIVQLNDSGTSYIYIDYLPKKLISKATKNFNNMWELRPENKHKIIMYEKEIELHRYSKSYLNTPTDLSHTVNSSYMYSGYDTTENNNDLPDEFMPYYDYMKSLDNKYNQVIANWYENGNDYIAQHSDCKKCMLSDAKISILSINENLPRELVLIDKKSKKEYIIQLDNGMIVTMCGKCQKEFTHGINKTDEDVGRRISLSFRQMKE